MYEERSKRIAQLYDSLRCAAGAEPGGRESAPPVAAGLSRDAMFTQLVSIRKGLMLVVRLMPLLNRVRSVCVWEY